MKRVVRWILLSLGGIVAVVLVAVGVLYVLSGNKLSATRTVSAERELVIPTDSASIARGAHRIATSPCGQCHGDDFGGKVFADAGPFALLVGPNITRGRGGNPPTTDVEWERAIRHGLRRDGTPLIVMPSEVFHALADDETAAIIAYLKQIPPVDRDVPRANLRIIGRLTLGAGQFQTAPELVPNAPHVATVDTTPGLEYGRHLVAVSGCRACHGESLSGGAGFGPDGKPPSNITPTGIGHYTEADFVQAMRTGKRPRGGAAISEEMPWRYFGKHSDAALSSIWLYLKSVPPKQFAER